MSINTRVSLTTTNTFLHINVFWLSSLSTGCHEMNNIKLAFIPPVSCIGIGILWYDKSSVTSIAARASEAPVIS